MQTSATPREMELAKLIRLPLNPRKTFDETKTAELAASIRSKGIVQPLVVRPNGKADTFEIVCGDRRSQTHQSSNAHLRAP